ncbi:uncharacterized protein LOC107614916 [Arachis ipaensis]|uniref:uncharacterized protein LOC107614916 n=1 Tax=Arachis ipaensis TaxID=130454 RepID=UPI0007AFAB49|nr:uncharacterized protein LOC107614916 [Arachis ipaensis]
MRRLVAHTATDDDGVVPARRSTMIGDANVTREIAVTLECSLSVTDGELTMSDDEIKQLCLMDIDKILHSYDKTLKDYPSMPLATEVDSSLLIERVIREELNFNRDDLKKSASDMLAIATPEQKYAFDKIVTAMYCDEGNLLSAEIRSRGDIVLNITSSGIASLLLPNGRTTHSRFKIPLNITKDSVCNIKPGFPQTMLLLKAKLIIWDEALMVLKLTKNMRLFVGTTASDQDETKQFGEWLLKVGDGLIGNMESQLDLYGPELLNSINCSGLPPHKLILKVGVPVMLLRNIDQSSGLCNGTRLQIRKLKNHVIECEVLTSNNVGHIALIPRMKMVPTNETVPVRFQ